MKPLRFPKSPTTSPLVSKDRPTILQIVPQLDAGGAELSAVEIAEAIVRAGGRALVLSEPGGRLAPRVTAGGGEVIAFPAATKNPLELLANARAIRRMVAAEGVDLIHARSRAPAWCALLAARQAAVPFVTTYHGAYNETNALKKIYNGVMARGDIVIANSRYTADLIAARYATPRHRLEVIHRGVDVGAFDPQRVTPARVAELRQHWDVAPDQRVILQAARLTRWKGQGVLIEAVHQLQRRGALQGAVAILAGDAQGRDGYIKELQAHIERLGLREHVRLVGHVEDIAAAYLASHVTVVASVEPEAFGRTAVEAAALGCPVIATNIGAPPETVLAQPIAAPQQITGWLVPPDDSAALAPVLAEALALAPAERIAIGERARRHVLAHFTTEAMQRRTLTVYDRLLGTALEGRFNAAGAGRRSLTETARQP
jgi:glycosyltransferase involved in cell wall biosynthesis